MPKTKSPVKILLVDDKPANLLTLEAVLESLGVELIRANSGEEALRHLTHEDFAVVLMDIRMPDMDGFETALSIRQRDPGRNIPIIFLTAAQGSDAEKAQAYAVGAIDYLLKPYVPSELRTKVSILSGLFQKNEELRAQVDKLQRITWKLDTENLILKAEMNHGSQTGRIISSVLKG
jgi:CheY-like chemotaxis protein